MDELNATVVLNRSNYDEFLDLNNSYELELVMEILNELIKD